MKRFWALSTGLLLTLLVLGPSCIFSAGGDECGNPAPIADFTYSPLYPYTNEPILFDGSASRDPNGFICNYTWSFDDGNTTLTLNPEVVHFYTTPGRYNVTLLVVDEDGATNSTTRTVVVKAHVLACFSHSPVEPFVDELVDFDASNSTARDGVIVSYAWDFSDGNKTAVARPLIVHSFAEAKAYNVTLNVTGSTGFWDVAWEIVNVKVPPISPPVAAFTWAPPTPQPEETVEFDASGSTPGSGNITSYAWNFGDGSAQLNTQPTAAHEYEDFGDYVVSLNVTNSDGLSDMVNHSITVVARPVADFFLNPSQPRVCSPVVFDASASDPKGGSIVSFEWFFEDDQSVGVGTVVTHRFKKMGEFVVSLNVTDSEGLSDVKNVTLTVLPHIADLNEDGVVDILDLFIFAKAYGSVAGGERWDQRADLDGNGVVNILDGVAIGRSYNMCADPFDP